MARVVWSVAATLVAAVSAQAAATDYFSETVKDFGTSPRGPVLTHYFALKNNSQQTITLGQPRVSCGCVTPSLSKNTAAPGETIYVIAQMDTRRIPQAGVLKSVTVFVPFLSPTFEEVQLRVQAIARDDLVMAPEGLSFGTVRKGQPATATVKVTFFAPIGWSVTDTTSMGAYIKATAAPLPQGQAGYEVTATVDAACPVGNWTTDVWVRTTAPGVERLRIPVTVNVIAPIAVNPDAVKIDAKVGKAAEQRVILQAGSAFKIKEIKGTDAEVTAETLGSDARPVHILKVSVTGKKAGPLNRTLEVVTDSKDAPTVSIPVKGTISE
jgi:hypothetical protein